MYCIHKDAGVIRAGLKGVLSAYKYPQPRGVLATSFATQVAFEGALKKRRSLSRLRLPPYEAPLTDSKRRARLLRTSNLPPVLRLRALLTEGKTKQVGFRFGTWAELWLA